MSASATVWWRVIGYAAIPSVMAWAGLYLAADVVKSEKIKRLFKALFLCLAALGIFIVAVVEKKSDEEHKGEVRYQREQYEYQRDQSARMTQKLEAGQAAAALLAQQFGDLGRDLKSMLGKRSPANPTGPIISASDISNLQQRASTAERAAQQLTSLYALEQKRQSWPLMAEVDHPGVWEFFHKNFPESLDLNGEDRFFLYYLVKHNCEIDFRSTENDMKNINALFYKEVAPFGAPAQMAFDRLERFGFVEKDARGFMAHLKEPYCSRFKKLRVP